MSNSDNWRPRTEAGWKAFYEFELLKEKQRREKEEQANKELNTVKD